MIQIITRIKILYNIFSTKKSKIYIHYLFKKKYFHDYNFNIYYPVLIPRKCTEEFINTLIYISTSHINPIILDLCGGAGIITVILNYKIKKKKIITIDYNYMCCLLALINYKNNTNIMCDLKYFISTIKKYNFISTNPPYISLKHLDPFCFYHTKKKQALYINLIGLKNFLIIIKKSYTILSHNSYLIFEHSYNQSKVIKTLLKNNGFINIYASRDLSRLTRFTYAEK